MRDFCRQFHKFPIVGTGVLLRVNERTREVTDVVIDGDIGCREATPAEALWALREKVQRISRAITEVLEDEYGDCPVSATSNGVSGEAMMAGSSTLTEDGGK